jgi:small subunit ribosomal protein S5
VLEAVGVHDILTKSQGSSNLLNVTMATLSALQSLRSPHEMAAMRGKKLEELLPFWERAALRKNVQVFDTSDAAAESVSDG